MPVCVEAAPQPETETHTPPSRGETHTHDPTPPVMSTGFFGPVHVVPGNVVAVTTDPVKSSKVVGAALVEGVPVAAAVPLAVAAALALAFNVGVPEGVAGEHASEKLES